MSELSVKERLRTIERRLDLIDEFQAKHIELAEEKTRAYKQLYETQRKQRIEYRDENTVLRREIKQLEEQLRQKQRVIDAAN